MPLRYDVNFADILILLAVFIFSISNPLCSYYIVRVKLPNLVISELDHKKSCNGFKTIHEALGEKVGMSN